MAEKEFKIKIGGDASSLKTNVESALHGLSEVGRGVEGSITGTFAKLITSPAAAVIGVMGALVQSMREALKYAHEINSISVRGDTTRREAAGIIEGSERSGISSESVMQKFNFMRRIQGAAMLDETSAQAKAFKELGISFQEMGESVPIDLFMRLIGILGEGTLEGEKFSAMAKILGRDFSELAIASKEGLLENIKEGMSKAPTKEQFDSARETEKWLRGATTDIGHFFKGVGLSLLTGIKTLNEDFTTQFWQQAYLPKGTEAPMTERQKDRALAAVHYGPDATDEDMERAFELQRKARQVKKFQASQFKTAQKNRLEEQAEALEGAAKSFKPIAPDKFARMGLFLTSGTEKMSNELVSLNKQNLAELKRIKAELTAIKSGMEDPAF